MSFLRLLRLSNLVILVATLYIITQRVIYPPLIAHGIAPSMTSKEYLLFLFIALCIGAGGYVYNDIIDQNTDTENNKRMIVGHTITQKIAFGVYVFLTLGPLLPMLSLIMEINRPDYLWYYFALVAIIFVYNQFLKSIALIGNVVVALLCSCAVVLPFLIEWDAMQILKVEDLSNYKLTLSFVGAFAVYCFLANLIREIIKDIEDIKGDQIIGLKTLPIVIGIPHTIRITLFLSASLLVCILSWLGFTLLGSGVITSSTTSIVVASLLLIIPLIGIIIKLTVTDEETDFHAISQYWKIYFVCGIIALILLT